MGERPGPGTWARLPDWFACKYEVGITRRSLHNLEASAFGDRHCDSIPVSGDCVGTCFELLAASLRVGFDPKFQNQRLSFIT
jgi:hypothetical protein